MSEKFIKSEMSEEFIKEQSPIVDKLFTEAFNNQIFGGAPFFQPDHNICVYVQFSNTQMVCFKHFVQNHNIKVTPSLISVNVFNHNRKNPYIVEHPMKFVQTASVVEHGKFRYYMIRNPHDVFRKKDYEDEQEEYEEYEDYDRRNAHY
jgi:hypothetical protein